MTATELTGPWPETRPSAVTEYHGRVRWRIALLILLAGVAALSFLLDIVVGSGTLGLGAVVQALFNPEAAEASARFIVWELRMPMSVMALVTGIGLSLSGLLMQTVLDNPLAEPFTLGVSAAAGLGAGLALAFAISLTTLLPWLPDELVTAANAFLFALLAVGLVVTLTPGEESVQSITLLGIAMHFVFSSLFSFVQYVASVDQLQSIVFWLMGSLQRATWLKVSIAGGLAAAVLPFVFIEAWALTALKSFGEQAPVFGVPVRRLRMVMLAIAALLAGAVTAVVGVVGFIGLVAPHVARMLVGEDHRFTIAATIAIGAVFATLASLATKLILPGAVLPLGMVTSLVGLPLFLWLVLKQNRGQLR